MRTARWIVPLEVTITPIALVLAMPQVHKAHFGVRLCHKAAREKCAQPQHKPKDRSPQFLRAEYERKGHQTREHDQFTIPAHEQVVAIADPANGY